MHKSPILTYLSAAVLLLFNWSAATAATYVTRHVAPSQTYSVHLFAKGTAQYFNPDAVVFDGHHVFVAYQNNTQSNGSDHGPSTIVEYTLNGAFVNKFNIIGHCDGLRLDPTTNLLWAVVNNDANPAMYTIDAATNTITSYSFSSVPHGGGYDDFAFTNGKAFVSASNPSLDSHGHNRHPAIDRVTLSGGTATIAPVLSGDAMALDIPSNKTVRLNEIDPDGMAVDPNGDAVLIDQGASEVVFVKNPGSHQQAVSRVIVGTQIDDIAWAADATGLLLVTDFTANATYVVKTRFVPGTVYVSSPIDSGVASFIGTLDISTGIITPVLIGLPDPSNIIFVP